LDHPVYTHKEIQVAQKVELNRIKTCQELDLFVKLKYQSSTLIIYVAIKYSVRDLLCDVNGH